MKFVLRLLFLLASVSLVLANENRPVDGSAENSAHIDTATRKTGADLESEHVNEDDNDDDHDGFVIPNVGPDELRRTDDVQLDDDEDYISIDASDFAKSDATYEDDYDPAEEEGLIVYNDEPMKE